jgi:hypothetical protein
MKPRWPRHRKCSERARLNGLARQGRLDEVVSRPAPAASDLALALAGDPPRDPAARAWVVIAGSDTLTRMLRQPSANSRGEVYLRGDTDIEGDVWAVVDAGSSSDLGRLGRDLQGFIRLGLRLRAGICPLRHSAAA